MIRTTLRTLVDRLLRRGKGAPSSPKTAPPRQPPPRPTPVTPRANPPAARQDHGHSHDHGGGHDHGHDHGRAEDAVPAPTPPAHDHGHSHDHGGGGAHDHGHSHDHGAAPAPARTVTPPAATPTRPSVTVQSSETPNPNARKFTASCRVVERGTIAANSKEEGDRHPLAAALWVLDGVEGVFAVADFVTVTKTAGASWDTLAPAVEAALVAALTR